MMSDDQSQALQQYTESTTGILGYLKNQLTSIGLWTNTPGSFQKVVSSSGYSWGLTSAANIAYCKEPCTGKWEPLNTSAITLIDIASDNANLYLLASRIKNVPAPPTPPPPPVIPPPPPPPPPPPAPTSTPVSGWMDFFPSSITDATLKAQAAENPAVYRLVMKPPNVTLWAHVGWIIQGNPIAFYNMRMALPPAPSTIQNGVDGKALFLTLDNFTSANQPTPNVNAAQRALLASNNNASAAIQWLAVHSNDAGVNDAFSVPTPPAPPPPPPVAPPPVETETPMIQKTVYEVLSLPGNPDKGMGPPPTEIPFKATSISVTNGYLWISGESKMAYCAKPCSTGNWAVKPDDHSLLGAGATAVYAVDQSTGSLVKTDETAQTGWAPVPGFADIGVKTLAAEADSVALYGADSKRLYRCDGTCTSKDQLETVDAQGNLPIGAKGSISVNPETKNVWMASSSSGTGGNLFQRLDTQTNMDPVLNYIDENQKDRDRIFNSLGGAGEIQTYRIGSNLAKREANKAVKQSVDMTGKLNDVDNNLSLLQRKVATAKNFGGNITASVVPLQILLFGLVLVAALYLLTGAIVSQTVLMWTSVVILSVAFGLAIYFSTTT